jgi:hypothetical protein
MWVGGRMAKALGCGWRGESSNFMSMTIHLLNRILSTVDLKKKKGVRAMGLKQPHFGFIHNSIPK